MAAVREGHLQQLAVLFQRYRARALGLCLRFVDERATAQDLVQEAFLRVLRYRGSFRPDSPFGAWFRRIVHNVCLDYVSASRRESGALRELGPEDLEWCAFSVPDAVDEEQVARVRAALAKLGARDRTALMLKRVEGWSYAEIATRFGTSEGAERVRVHRALQRLRVLVHKTHAIEGGGYAVP